MYINEFWCGVLVTIGVEFIAIIGYSIQLYLKEKNKKNKIGG